jgi:DNA-binding PucR family transcriptional regulator
VAEPAALARSRVEAGEVALVARRPVAALEDRWAAVTAARAAEAVRGQGLLGPLVRLREIDDTRGTAHLASLAAWLDHPGEPARAAAALHVHPNTLRYRLQRLREAVDLELDDPSVRLAVRLQLAALGHRP